MVKEQQLKCNDFTAAVYSPNIPFAHNSFIFICSVACWQDKHCWSPSSFPLPPFIHLSSVTFSLILSVYCFMDTPFSPPMSGFLLPLIISCLSYLSHYFSFLFPSHPSLHLPLSSLKHQRPTGKWNAVWKREWRWAYRGAEVRQRWKLNRTARNQT